MYLFGINGLTVKLSLLKLAGNPHIKTRKTRTCCWICSISQIQFISLPVVLHGHPTYKGGQQFGRDLSARYGGGINVKSLPPPPPVRVEVQC